MLDDVDADPPIKATSRRQEIRPRRAKLHDVPDACTTDSEEGEGEQRLIIEGIHCALHLPPSRAGLQFEPDDAAYPVDRVAEKRQSKSLRAASAEYQSISRVSTE